MDPKWEALSSYTSGEGLDFFVDETPTTTSSPSTSKRMATKQEFPGWEMGADS